MASKTTSIPRFLLPQHGPLWHTAAARTTTPFARPALQGDVGPVLVRYVSKTATTTTTSTITPRAVVAGSRTASTKSAAAKAARASPPTKQPPSSARASAGAQGEKRPEPAAQSQQQASPPWQDPPAPAPRQADPSKPIVLEKPERFNPPSHGARLPRSMPKHYGGPATADEVKAQRARSYPGLPPPENSWSHWFIHSRGIHLFITLGTLSGLAAFSFAQSFKADSPFADLIPPISELPRHPLQYLGVCLDVVRLHEEHLSAQTAEKRRRKADDLAKRNEYRKAHGLEPATGLWGARSVEPPPPPPPSSQGHDPQSPIAPGELIAAPATATAPAAETDSDGKRKKFLGIF
ncbi:hypothetical protein F4775DRAFT_586573 [Biscogniauxia sp. FL1348]|nr:hypothetical protein F4775DRAFT_586573 [Biscogniauxia sp. FL1348]